MWLLCNNYTKILNELNVNVLKLKVFSLYMHICIYTHTQYKYIHMYTIKEPKKPTCTVNPNIYIYICVCVCVCVCVHILCMHRHHSTGLTFHLLLSLSPCEGDPHSALRKSPLLPHDISSFSSSGKCFHSHVKINNNKCQSSLLAESGLSGIPL